MQEINKMLSDLTKKKSLIEQAMQNNRKEMNKLENDFAQLQSDYIYLMGQLDVLTKLKEEE